MVETPEGINTGSSTAIVRITDNTLLPLAQTSTNFGIIAAEGAVIDLGKRGVLFTLLSSDNGRGDSKTVIIEFFASQQKNPPYGRTNVPAEYIRYFRSLPPQTLPLPQEFWPTFVRFKDHNDPESVEKVDPHTLNAVFGEGVRLISVTLNIVPSGYFPFRTFWQGARPHWLFGTPVSYEVKAHLPWVGIREAHKKSNKARYYSKSLSTYTEDGYVY